MRPLLHAVLAAGTALLAGACASDPYCDFAPGADALCRSVQGDAVAADSVFFGESHDDREHHALELETLEAMARRGGPLLLGLEMFQRPFQEPLDDYVAGRIDEIEMLRRTEYFKRWNFDYTFYAPMWRFCRERGIRVVALNAEASVTTKVRQQGLAKLTAEERAGIAADIDLANPAHRARIAAALEAAGHPMSEPFYEAMTVWDETMADSAAAAVAAAGAGARILVVAGRNHCEPTGIPDRFVRRRPGASRVILLADNAEDAPRASVERDGEAFVVTFPAAAKPATPKLGILFDPKPSEAGLTVLSVVEGGAAAQAGIAANDVIVGLEGAAVHDTTDLRYVLDTHRIGDVVRAQVRRGEEVVEIDVTLVLPPEAAAVR